MGKLVIRPTTSKGVVILGNTKSPPPTVTLPDGRTITGQYLNAENGLYQFKLGLSASEAQNMTVSYEGKTSSALDFAGGQAEYRTESGDVTSIKQAPNKALRGGGSAGGATTSPGGYGAIPENLVNQFPNPQINPDRPIPLAPYNETSIKQFAGDIANFNRDQVGRNSTLAKESALSTLDTELAGLERFAPGAANLQRSQVGLDNTFNQAQRSQQVDQTLPNARGDLAAQRDRANTYASGKSPDSVIDAALELGVRSSAADAASAGGFGVNSSASRKLSDLQSADRRLQLAAFGEQLVGTNQQQSQNLLLAPTEYAQAGSQISAAPSQSASQVQQNQETRLDRTTVLDPAQALTTQIQQQQFKTNLIDKTNTQNASNALQNGQFNTANVNNFALSKFNYKVGYANAVAGAGQIDINTTVGLLQQEQAKNTAEANKTATQNNNDVKANAAKPGFIAGAISDVGNIASIGTSIASLYETGKGAYAGLSALWGLI